MLRSLAPSLRALLVLAAAASPGACGAGDPCAGQAGACVALHVSAAGAVGPVDAIHVDVTGALRHQLSRGFPSGTTLPVAIALLLPAASGSIDLHVVGTSGGATVGLGAGSVAIGPGVHARVDVLLSPAEASCSDGARDGDESDIDCGGPMTTPSSVGCPRCRDGASCGASTDCASGDCAPGAGSSGTCVSCSDGKLDGSESDVDCGGATCPTCSDGRRCVGPSDCTSLYCDGRSTTCQEPTCADGVQNGDETDVDCGGAHCPGCAVGRQCAKPGDCASLYCDARGQCATATCSDNVKNGTETDVDCGGGACPACALGFACVANGDCASGDCWQMRCATAPVLTSVTPSTGPIGGGIGVTLDGSHFAAGSKILVTFGGAMASTPSWESSTTVKAILPPGNAGPVNVAVTLGDGQTARLANGFTYTP